MKRRAFIAGLGSAAAWPGLTRGQQPAIPKVGYVFVGQRGTDVSGAGLRQGLVDRGYEVGKNLVLERRASLYGLPVKVPAPYPLKNFDLANRVAILGQVEGWCPDYVRATYRRWFVDGLEAGSEPNLSESLKQIGQDPDRVVTQALTDAVGSVYDGNTEEARSLKIFGAPTFVVRGELFWGDDRLDDAITWLSRGKLDLNN